ncbi:hypothetical protein WA577_005571 [Blastocystis sp. JDR]
MNALHIVHSYNSKQLFLECFGEEFDSGNHTIKYVTEAIPENIRSVYMGIGSVRLNLIRKWIQDILTGLADLHQKTESHDPIIHGRIRLQHLLYHRSTGQVRIGGYYWLTVANPGQQYQQVKWAEDDYSIGYYAPEVFTDGLWTTAVDIYALGMAVIHLLSGCHPYGELDDNTFMLSAMKRHLPPKGLLCLQSIDETLFQFLQQCIAPYEKRPSAEELLKHPFFSQDTDVEIPLKTPRVEGHPNNKDNSFELTFPSAFLRTVSHRREPALGQRFDHFSLEELSKAEKLSETPKMEKLPETPKMEKLPEVSKAEKLPETPKKEKLPEVSKTEKKEMETEVAKVEKKETLHTTVSHLRVTNPALTPVSSEERLVRNLPPSPPTRRNSLLSMKLPLAVRFITVHLHLDAMVLGVSLAVHHRVDLSDPCCPWSAVNDLVGSLNALRRARHMEELSGGEVREIQRGFCRAVVKALAAVQVQMEGMVPPVQDVFSRLRDEAEGLTVSCLIPAHLFNDDPNSDFGILARFPVAGAVSLSEAVRTTSETMEAAIEEVRKRSGLGELNPEAKEWVKEEVQWMLELKLRQLVVCHLPEAHVLLSAKIDAAITAYQLPKSGLLSPSPSRPSVPSQEAPSISVLSSPFNSSLSVAHLSRPVKSQPAASSARPAEDVRPFEGEPLPPSSLLFLRIDVPVATSTSIMSSTLDVSLDDSFIDSLDVSLDDSFIDILDDSFIDSLDDGTGALGGALRVCEVTAALLQWLRAMRLLRAGDAPVVQQRAVEAIEAVVGKVTVEEAKAVKKTKSGVEEAKVARKSKEVDYVELTVAEKDPSSYKVNVSRKKIEGADGGEKRISFDLDFRFDQRLEKVTEDIMNYLVNENGDIKDDAKSKLKDQILADLEREIKRVKGE